MSAMYPLVNTIFSWYMRRRFEQIRQSVDNPVRIQKEVLRELLRTASHTVYGEKYGFRQISNPTEFAERVPVVDYEGLKPYIDRILHGEQNVLWPSEIRWFAKSSGTTSDKSKFIPVSFEALEECHFRGGKDVLSIYCQNYPDTRIFEGKGLLIGGSHEVNKFSDDTYFGDLSAVMMNNMPYWSTLLSTPGQDIALMSDWEQKLERMAEAVMNEDVRSISGVPTWTLVLIKRILEKTGKTNVTEIWPNLELFIHGGVSFTPYKNQFEQLIPTSNMHYLETYNASEGFIAIKDDPERDDMLLMLDYGIYYEFLPLTELEKEHPQCVPLEDVKTGVTYALLISTNAGLWRYLIGDTVVFTSTSPYRIRIAGRTKSYINTFGEELMVHNSDYAIAAACEETGARVREYTAGPIYLTTDHKGGHEWFIEFEKLPENREVFMQSLDKYLKACNSDYEAKRAGDLALESPALVVCPEGTFYRWLKKKEKLGGQHKVPRLSNRRNIIEELQTILEERKSD